MNDMGSLGRPAEILLVEDNENDVRLTELAFENVAIPHRLHVVNGGDDALALLRRQEPFSTAPRPDLILLDLNMPGTDGRDVLREIKQDSSLKRIPVIILTTSEAATDIVLTYSLQANAYLTKPIDLDEWEDLVQTTARFWLKLVKHPPTGS